MGMDKQKKVLLILICFEVCVSMMSANEKEEEEDLPECRPHKDSTTLRLEVAAHGYDVWKADPFAEDSGDPGQKDRIFDVQCIDLNTAQGGYYDFFSAYPDYSCRKTFNARTFKTFKDYLSTISSTTEYSNSFSAEASGGAFGVSLSASAKYKKSGNSELAKTRRLFEEKYGEIRVATAVCKTYDARINTNWLRPKFSRNFRAALERLQDTLTESGSRQKATMKRFIDSFGTHIMTEVDFGAKMLYEKRFTSKSTNTKASSKRKECVKESVSGCLGGGYEGAIVEVSAEACVGSKNGQCTNDEFDNSWGEKNSLSSTKLRTIGSPLSSETDWGKEDSFHPVPIRRKLELISSLFTAINLKKSQFYGFRQSLDHEGIRTLFNNVASQYCTIVLGKSSEECTEDLSGCGLNDNCEDGQRCRNDKTKPHGYFCLDPVDCVPGQWEQWSTCRQVSFEPCVGLRTRTRETLIQPANGGSECNLIETSYCNEGIICKGDEITSNCGGTYNTNDQYINSPNYPSNYGRHTTCTWKLEVPNGSRLKLKRFTYTFERISTSTDCSQFDVLRIYDGRNSGSSEVAKLCATSGTQEDILSSSNSLFLSFKSDGTFQKQGFKIFYQFV